MPTRTWRDLIGEAHDRAFVVAGATRAAVLEDLRAAVDRTIAEGTTLQDFRRDFDRLVQAHGWNYRGARGWRTSTIYRTNLRTAYAAGRYRQMTSDAVRRRRPFWRYRHGGSAEPREQHVTPAPGGWNGLVLRGDDPWWETHYPPNGWGCSCYVETLSQADLDRLDVQEGEAPEAETYEHVDRETGEVVDVPRGIDFGWDYAPGASWTRSFFPRFVREWPDSASRTPEGAVFNPQLGPVTVPEPRPLPASVVLPDTLGDAEYVGAFEAELGEQLQNGVFQDVMGDPVVIDERMFTGFMGSDKLKKRDRHRYVRVIARALAEPDEIWVRIEPIYRKDAPGTYRVMRRYLAWFEIEGEEQPALASFTWTRDMWTGVTAFQTEGGYIEMQQRGERIYRRNP